MKREEERRREINERNREKGERKEREKREIETKREKRREKERKDVQGQLYQSAFNSQKEKLNILAEMLENSKSGCGP